MSTAIPNVNDLVAGDVVVVDTYYSYNAADDDYTAMPFNVYQFDDKISVVSASGGDTYDVYVELNGVDELLFTGTVDAGHVIPKAMALECGAGFQNQVVDLSAGPMSFARYLELGAAAEETGAYLLTMKGKSFAKDLAKMDAYESIAMVDIESGVALLKHDTAIRAGYVEIAGGSIHLEEDLTYAGNLSIVEGSLKIGTGDVAHFTGIFNDLGVVYGHGKLDIHGGYMSVANGAAVDVKTWESRGTASKTAEDYIEDALTFAGNFIVGANTEFTFYKAADLTVKEVHDINGQGGQFTMYDWDPIYQGDETIDVQGAVAKGESFSIGTTDVLELGNPVKFKGTIDGLDMGSVATASQKAMASGEVALDGIWNYVSTESNAAHTATLVTMQDIANGLIAHIAFAGTWEASEFSFFDQIKGVTPTTVIARTID